MLLISQAFFAAVDYHLGFLLVVNLRQGNSPGIQLNNLEKENAKNIEDRFYLRCRAGDGVCGFDAAARRTRGTRSRAGCGARSGKYGRLADIRW
jgi:hypothetical protein